MNDITILYKEFKSETDRQAFIKKQHDAITTLMQKNKQLEDEISHLKKLVTSTVPLIGTVPDNKVEKIILTPAEALLETQIALIQDRGIFTELSLEDVKKLDILIKNKLLIKKESPQTKEAEFSKIKLSPQELLSLAATPDEPK